MSIQSKRTLVIGGMGEGKTPWIKQIIKEAQAKNPDLRALFVLESTPISLADVPRTDDFNQLARFCTGKGILKFWPKEGTTSSPLFDTLKFLRSRYRNGILVLEDLTETLDSHLPDDIKHWLFQGKNKGVEMFFVTHSLADTPAKLRRYMNRIVLFHTGENIEESESRYWNLYPYGYFQTLKRANKEVYRPEGTPKKEGWIQERRIFNTGM